MPQTISAHEALEQVINGSCALIDVRSEGEFLQGSIPGFLNAPILNDHERHQVGLSYRNRGQAAAVELGYELTASTREQRISRWRTFIQGSSTSTGIITCWRGGLRSALACVALRDFGFTAHQVHGGYKAMRQLLQAALEKPKPMYVLAGLTGSGKTKLIKALPNRIKIDLEALAEHRGSSFGQLQGITQPSIATFENRLAIAMRRVESNIVIEDESRGIGRVSIPNHFAQQMLNAPVIYLDAPIAIRAQNIYDEYIHAPLQAGIATTLLRESAIQGVKDIHRRLGGALATQLTVQITDAFNEPVIHTELHLNWISVLLDQYYDKSYTHSFERQRRQIVFQGDFSQCNQWILEQFD